VAIAVIAMAAGGCGADSRHVTHPFAVSGGVESGPSSGLWGDSSSGPDGQHVGCIRQRRYAVLIAVHNRLKRTITLLGGGGPQPLRAVIERVAVQVRLTPPPSTGDAVVVGMRSWNGRDSSPVAIPPERDAWVQSNFLMRNCALLRPPLPATTNGSITLEYSVGGSNAAQVVSVPAARILLTRGPEHPSLPINHIG
jgi:hypothetical protein